MRSYETAGYVQSKKKGGPMLLHDLRLDAQAREAKEAAAAKREAADLESKLKAMKAKGAPTGDAEKALAAAQREAKKQKEAQERAAAKAGARGKGNANPAEDEDGGRQAKASESDAQPTCGTCDKAIALTR